MRNLVIAIAASLSFLGLITPSLCAADSGTEELTQEKMTFSADGRYVASLIDAGSIAVWGVDSHKLIGVIKPPDNILDAEIDTAAPQPQILLQLYDGRIAVSDLAGQKSLQWLSAGSRKMYFNEGKMLAYGWQVQRGDDDKTLYLVNLSTRKEYPVHLPVSTNFTGLSILFSSDGQDIALYTYLPFPKGHGYSMWRSHRGPNGFTQFTGLSREWLSEEQVMMSRDGSQILAVEMRPNEDVRVWGKDARHSIVIDCMKELPPYSNMPPASMALSDDGQLFAFGSGDDHVYVYSTSTGKRVASLSPLDTLKAAGIETPSQLNRSRSGTEQNTGPEDYMGDIGVVAISPDKRQLCVQIGLSTILWDLVTGKATLLPQPPYSPSPYRGPTMIG